MERSTQRTAAIATGIGALLLAGAWWGWRASPSPISDVPRPDAQQRSLDRPTATQRTEPSGHNGSGSESPPPPGHEPAALQALGGASTLTDEELDALAAQLESDPRTHVVCDLGVPVRHSEAYLAIGDPSGFNGRRVQVIRGRAYLQLIYDYGELAPGTISEREGVFSLEGYGPGAVAWSDPPEDGGLGRCTVPVDPEPGRASLTGTLTLQPSGQPAGGAWLEGCGNLAFADQHGVVHMDIVPDPCTVIAMRQDGLLRTVSQPVAVVPKPGRDVVVDIELPEAMRGGLGVQLSHNEAGQVQIDGVLETGPAESAGLQSGDIVVEVDGQPLEELSMGEVVQLIGGDAGSDVALTIDREGQRMTFDVMREVLSAG